MSHEYKPRRELRPHALAGISQEQIDSHWALYEGYVKNVNALNQRLAEFSHKKDYGLEFGELKRRMGFEYDGMILHERYFGIMRAGQEPLGDFAELTKLQKTCFGGFGNWKEEFAAMGKMRGVGWVILYLDPRNRALANHWIGLHEQGHPAGFAPLVVMDVWEHAYMLGGGGDRARYVSAFLNNVDWPKVEIVLKNALRAPADALQESH